MKKGCIRQILTSDFRVRIHSYTNLIVVKWILIHPVLLVFGVIDAAVD